MALTWDVYWAGRGGANRSAPVAVWDIMREACRDQWDGREVGERLVVHCAIVMRNDRR